MENYSGLVPSKQLLKSALEITRERAKVLYGISLSIYGLLVVFMLVVGVGLWGSKAAGDEKMISGGILAVIAVIVFVAFAVWAQISLLYSIVHQTDFKQSFVHSKKFYWKYLWTSLVIGLIVLLGFILLIIPGLIWAGWYVFATMIVIAEGLSGRAAMKASKSYVKGRWWGVIGRLAVPSLILFGLNILVGIFFRKEMQDIINTVIGFVFTPYLLVYEYLLYKNAKETSQPVAAEAPAVVS